MPDTDSKPSARAEPPADSQTDPQAAEIARLRAEIARHDRLYFQNDAPEIADSDYDLLRRRLEGLEAARPDLASGDSPTSAVAPPPGGSDLPEVVHEVPMLSLDKALETEDLQDFEDRVKRFLGASEAPAYHTMPKFDGLAVELVYRDRALALASTRGDGRTGENITANASAIGAVPKALGPEAPAGRLLVRGEVYMDKADFAALNEDREAAGLPVFANPRNAAAGSLRRLDAGADRGRGLRFFAYGLAEPGDSGASTYSGLMGRLSAWGLPVEAGPATGRAEGLGGVLEAFRRLEAERDSLGYEVDGLVVMVDDLALWARLGATARAPRYAVAMKFKPRAAATRVLSIEVQVGRTGALTPVAVMEPVAVGGVTVSQATLHNEEELRRKDVRPGDLVRLQRAGDVIPEIIDVVLDARPPDLAPFEFPKNCPVCGTEATRRPGEVVARCPNASCPAQIGARLIHFASKNCLDIEGLGPKAAAMLLEEDLVRRPSDLFRLGLDRLEALPRFGAKSAANLVAAIDKARTKSLWRFVNGLSIRHVGERSSRILAAHFGSLKALSEAKAEELLSLDDIGPEVAASVVDFFQSPLNRTFVADLVGSELGVAPAPEAPAAAGGRLSGKRLVLTGALPNLTRAEAKARITAAGGRVLSSVSKGTDYVVAGDSPGSKLDEARKLGVAVLDEKALLEMLAGG